MGFGAYFELEDVASFSFPNALSFKRHLKMNFNILVGDNLHQRIFILNLEHEPH